MEDDTLINEFELKLREREKDKEITQNGFCRYSYETTKERCNRIHRENQTIYAGIKEKFRNSDKYTMRNRRAEFDVHPPMTFQDTSDQSRLKNMKRTIFDTEGFDLNYFNNYFTRRSEPRIKNKLLKIVPKRSKNNICPIYEPYIDGSKNIGEKATSLQSRAIGPTFKIGKSSNTISNISSESLRNSRLLNFAYEYWKMNNPNSIIPSQKQYIDTNQSNVSTTTSVEVKSILKKPDLNSVEKNNWSSNINQTPTANRVSPIPGFSTDDRK